MHWFYHDLIIVIKWCIIPYEVWAKLYYFRETRFFVWEIENFDELQIPQGSSFFCWNFAHFFYLTMCAYSGFFLFCLDLELFAKNRKDLVSTHSLFTFLIIIQDLNKIKKILNTLLQTSWSRKRAQNFSQKLYGSLSSSKFSIFQTNNLVSRKQ